VPIPDDLKCLPLSDMILRAVAHPATIVRRERREDGRLERMADWRARAVWDVMWECGVDSTRTFVSDDEMRAFDDEETKTLTACSDCGSTDPTVRAVIGRNGIGCDDPNRWHSLMSNGSYASGGGS
jgi:hypothetical protein